MNELLHQSQTLVKFQADISKKKTFDKEFQKGSESNSNFCELMRHITAICYAHFRKYSFCAFDMCVCVRVRASVSSQYNISLIVHSEMVHRMKSMSNKSI